MDKALGVDHLLERLPLGVLILDRDLNVVGSNRRALELLDAPVTTTAPDPVEALLSRRIVSHGSFCGACGARQHAGGRFCGSCGTALTA